MEIAGAVDAELALAREDAGGRLTGTPAVDDLERAHVRPILGGMKRRLVPAVSPQAATVGYSRAVRDGRHVYVAGTAPVGCDSPDAYVQAQRCLEIVVAALAEVGAKPEHVVRTRVYLVDAADWEAVGRAHGEVFGDIRPASAMVVVAALLDPAWRVEIEADAVLP